MIRVAVLAAINAWPRKAVLSVTGYLASLKIISTGASGGLPGEVYSNLPAYAHSHSNTRATRNHTPAVIILLSDAKNNENPTRWLPPRRLLTGCTHLYRWHRSPTGPPYISTVFPSIRNLMRRPCNKYPRSLRHLLQCQERTGPAQIYDHIDTQLMSNRKRPTHSTFAGASISSWSSVLVFTPVFSRLP